MAYAQTTFTELKSRLEELAGGHGKFWCPFELELALNEALSVWQLLVGEFSANATWAAAANGDTFEALYNPSTGATDLGVLPLKLWRLATVSTYTTGGLAEFPKLTQVSVKDLDYGSPGWRAAAASTLESWAPFGLNAAVFPPHTAQDLRVDYYSGERLLNMGGDYIQLGAEELTAILSYAVWQLNLKCGEGEALDNSKPLKELFTLAAETRNKKLQGSALYKKFLGGDSGELQPPRNAEAVPAGRS